ncbi:MAG: nitroreductase family protein [Leptolyngbyaceae cyanobacterium bins.59]|nr:nitroreductase family protein [Leptolyngbyaceae cyanobacterium bins.59]
MQKTADTQSPVLEVIQQRWSPLAFSSQPVEAEKIYSVLEAARWAASSYNEQPWTFIVTTQGNQEAYDRLLSCLAESNQTWAKQAPILILSVAKLFFQHNGVENRHAFHDVGQATAHLILQATALGLFAHQMAGFDGNKAREQFAIPDRYEPVAVMALGYPGNLEDLPENLHDRELKPRSRKPVSEVAIGGSWGTALSL